ncbi:isopentenyl-diphosphate delta-isomerase [Edwardsiella piscicida]|nr:isopentenyl-diphosphate delta-isomerase [Edwardsiella piscicida]
MIEVVLVDEYDVVQGHMEKLAAHRQGCLHRALSVYIFNARGGAPAAGRDGDAVRSDSWADVALSG